MSVCFLKMALAAGEESVQRTIKASRARKLSFVLGRKSADSSASASRCRGLAWIGNKRGEGGNEGRKGEIEKRKSGKGEPELRWT